MSLNSRKIIKYNLKNEVTLLDWICFNFGRVVMIKKIRSTILNFMMSGSLFGDGDSLVKKWKKMAKQIIIDSLSEKDTEKTVEKEWTVYEAKTDYITKVSDFLQDWVKQMKKDLL